MRKQHRVQGQQDFPPNEHNLQDLVETIPALVWRARPDGHIDYINKRLLEYLGSPLEKIIDWGWMDKVHPDDIAFKVKSWIRNLAAMTSHDANCRFQGADGTYRWFNVRGEPLRDADGRVLNWYGILIDIDDQKRAEETSRQSEARFRDFAESASDWLWETGPDYKFTLLTENAFGSDPANRIGTKCWDRALDLEMAPEKWRQLWATLDARKPFRDFAYCSVGCDNSAMYVRSSGKPVFDAKGEFQGYRGTGTNVTSVVRAQQAEASLRGTENELRDMQEKLARASQAATVAELSASIVHEINQPLAGIIASAQTCRTWLCGDNPNLPRARAAIERIVRDGSAAADIIRRIRALFKQTAPMKDSLHINEVIYEVGRLAQDELNRRGVSMELDLAQALPPLLADRIQIQQVLMNLIRNGADAMEDMDTDAKRLIVRSHSADGFIVLEVCDYGTGLTHPDKAFEPFYSTKKSGLGVGLTISRSIIQAHGGSLRVRDNQPQGAIFWLTLPLWSEARDDTRN